MKRTLVIALICALLCLAALADVQSEISVPTVYSAVWQSSTGKTIITVDAVVEVPGVRQMMVYPTSQRVFAIDDLRRVAAACFGHTPYGSLPDSLDSLTQHGANSDPTGVVIQAASENAAGNLALLTFNQLRGHDGNLWYGMIQFEGRGHGRYQLADLPVAGTADADSREKAVSIACAIDPDMELVYEGLSTGYEEGSGMDCLRGDMFVFTRTIHGVPVVWTGEECYAYDNFGDTYNLKTPYESMIIIIDRQDGSVWLRWQAPHTIDITSGQAAALLPFDQIMAIAAQLFPLKYQFQEQYLSYRDQDANRLTVNRITLSYSRVQNRDNPTGFSMVPVWDFFNADEPAESFLTVNAIDGTVIDRGFGY